MNSPETLSSIFSSTMQNEVASSVVTHNEPELQKHPKVKCACHNKRKERDMTYAIRFDFPTDDGPLFGGDYQGACGWAPSLNTAFLFDDADRAHAMLTNGYGSMAKWGKVIKVTDGGPA